MAQISFTNATTSVFGTQEHDSTFPIALADMNGDQLDDLIILAEDNITLYLQNEAGDFTQFLAADSVSVAPWSVCIADVDQNGYNDIFTGGEFTPLKLLRANDTGTAYDVEDVVPANIFLQGSNFADIDNDGDVDLFACHDLGLNQVWENEAGILTLSSPLLINTGSTLPSDNSGNYSSIWTDYDNDGDLDMYLSKCKFGIGDPTDPRRLNLLFQNNGENQFLDVTQAAGLQPQGQSWASDFADVDNDGDLDVLLINHDIPTLLFKNNGDGSFTDFTSESGLSEILTNYKEGFQCIFKDFDNDGYVDLFLTANAMDEHYLLHNNGDFSFSEVDAAFPNSPATILSMATGDLNNDGLIDIHSSYKGETKDIVWFNTTITTNNYIAFILQGTASNRNGIGARAELYGPWGKQIREVRSGESYGIMNSYQLHFGIGSATQIDSLIIRWPSGTVDLQDVDFTINQTSLLVEGNLPNAISFTEKEKDFIRIFPNPTTAMITVLSDQGPLEKIMLYNLSQELIIQYKNVLENPVLDLSHLVNGVYYLAVQTLAGVQHFPVIKID